ncbi:MAG: FAD:protein FMN transferase, partial [Rikenellaceae bacterium]
ETTQITEWMAQNILLADSISRLSDGIYDITVAPLVKAWGFGAERREEHPNVDSLLQFVGYEGLRVERGFREIELHKRDSRMQIDLNSIAKGFAVDRVSDILDTYGSQNYIVEIGGELQVCGVNPSGKWWRVGVESPIDGNMSEGELLERRVQLHPYSPLRAMATSGNYRRFYLNDEGEKIVHTIDPTTGLSKSSTLLSATVIAATCAEADAYATMFMAAGDQCAEEIAASIENCEVYFIYNNAREGDEKSEYREYFSEGMRKMLMKE